MPNRILKLRPSRRGLFLGFCGCLLALTGAIPTAKAAENSAEADYSTRLKDDRPGSLRFFGSPVAELFTREIEESFRGSLQSNYVSQTGGGFPIGFIRASPAGQLWSDTMWPRDGGTFLRELTMWGSYEHAACLAECLVKLVEKNQEGFYSFPEYFKGSQTGAGTELDGTASIVIGMVLLWERLPDGHPAKSRLADFLSQDASPIGYLAHRLKSKPLVAGSGEFGGGCFISGDHYNVVQNGLVRLALLKAADFAQASGKGKSAKECRRLADAIGEAMEQYLVDGDGCWIWCVDLKTMKPDPAVVDHEINRGFGGLNGVACMYSDAQGLEPLASSWKGIEHCEKTFSRLYQFPLRKQQFDKYGIWTQFDAYRAGLSSGPSYGDGYALQTMLLFDKLDMADKSLAWLANSTYEPVPEYKIDRASPYYFYERSYSPDAVGKIPLDQGCGALNQVNVTEPMKAARLILGVDDSNPDEVRILPRVPPSWKGVEARNWPIRTRSGVVRADIRFEKQGDAAEFTLKVVSGPPIAQIKIRMPSASGYVWREMKEVSDVRVP